MGEIFVLEYSQDIPEASLYEIENFCAISGSDLIYAENGIALISGSASNMSDSAFVKRIARVIEIKDRQESISGESLPTGKFYVRFLDGSTCHDSSLEPYLGQILGGRGRISFASPDFIVRVYHLEKWYVSIETFSGNSGQFENRRAPRRPFFSPISMHPRIARFLVNVSNAPRNGTILDPFCGTGGILMEAGSTGRHVVGIDMSLQMTAGAKLNLKYFGIRDFRIITGNFLEVEIPDNIDSVVTDLPYGRNSPMHRQDILELYRKSMEKFGQILKRGSRCVIAVSDLQMLPRALPYFKILKVIDNRIHKSLTRHYIIMEKQ
ncbi:MAG: methyltransferase domain-containing protein [Candidatus Thermoplasmatota archaeon]|jgi:tRNA (guanine10-N2)-dimethyltransferase|nr:methyltransferase domain-containing protein [Candidatus Thermoplasmatota archaeon]